MGSSLPNSVAPLLVQAGALGYITLHSAFLGAGTRGRDRLPAWIVGWCVAALAFVIARLVQRTTDLEMVALGAGRAQYAAAVVGSALGVGVVHAFLGLPLGPRKARLITGAAVVSLLVIMLTPLALGGPVVIREDAFGTRYLAGTAQPTVILVVAGYVAAFRFAIRTLLEVTPPRSVRTLRICIVVFMLLALNDVLQSAGLIHTIHLFEYGICGFTLVGVYVLMRKMDGRFSTLEGAVSERAQELEAQKHTLARARGDVRAAESRYRQLSDASLEGVLVHDGTTVVDCNRAAEEIFGARGALRGRPVRELFAPSDELAQGLSGDAPAPTEVVALRADAVSLPVEIMSRRNAWGSNDGVVVVVHDIREKKRAQARLLLADRMASLSTVAAGMAHEINNPLAYAMLNLEIAAHELEVAPDPCPRAVVADVRELIGLVHGGNTRIRRIVASMHALSRGDSDETHAVDLESVLDAAVLLADNQVRHRAKLVRSGTSGQRVVGSETGLTQVFLNLLVNAAQSIEEGHAAANEVAIAVTESAEGVFVEIRDTGKGIAPEILPSIFDPFFTTKHAAGGTGLGLSICHGILAGIGGGIAVEARPRGTTFRVRLVPATSLHRRASLARVDVPSVRRGRILIIDDEPAVGVALGRALRDHETVTASTGQEAIERCRSEHFDVVLCDLMMPEMTGMEFFARLREFDPATAARAVFLSGGAFTEGAREFLASVPNPRLDKPFDLFVVQELVQELLARQPRPSGGVLELRG